MNISFKANFIGPAGIIKLSDDKKSWNPTDESFVKLNYRDTEDMFAINKVANNYKKIIAAQDAVIQAPESVNYAESIRNNFNHYYNNPELGVRKNFFAITTQKDTFEYLDNQKVLGIAETWDDILNGFLEIKFLQVNPLHKNGENTAEYKHIGTAMLDSIRSFFKDRNLYLIAEYNAIEFYLKYGFKVLRGNQLIYKIK